MLTISEGKGGALLCPAVTFSSYTPVSAFRAISTNHIRPGRLKVASCSKRLSQKTFVLPSPSFYYIAPDLLRKLITAIQSFLSPLICDRSCAHSTSSLLDRAQRPAAPTCTH